MIKSEQRLLLPSASATGQYPISMDFKQALQWRHCLIYVVITMAMLVEGIHGSKDGQLSSYRKALFRDGSGMALNQMVVSNESGTDFVYVGGVSTLYQLDMDLELLRQESTIPSDTTPCEDQACLYETKILEVAPLPVGKLIQCGGPEGKCELRNLMNISREYGYAVDWVVNDGLSVGVVAPRQFETPEVFMYVATSIDPYYPERVVKPITQRELQHSFSPQFAFGYSRAISAAYSTVDYIQAISWKTYNFFIVHSGLNQARLGRICSDNNEDELEAYSEIILSCHSYGILQSAHIEVNDVLYGVFTNGTHSALCSYTMSDIQEKFVDTTCGCVIDDDPSCYGQGTEISYLGPNSLCSPRSGIGLRRQYIEEDYQCGDENQPVRFRYAQATSDLPGNLIWTGLPGGYSSIISFHKEDNTVVLVTTSSPSTSALSKIHVQPNNTGRLYETLDLEATGDVLNDVHINQETEELFLFTTSELMKLSVVNCSQYTNFADCIGLTHDDGDPFCGWCTLENKCSRFSECPSAIPSNHEWRQYNQKCIMMIKPEPYESLCLGISDPVDGIELSTARSTTTRKSTTESTTAEEEQFTTETATTSECASDPIPVSRERLSPGTSAGIALLVILLTASVIVNVIQFMMWRRLKSEIDCKNTRTDVPKKTNSYEVNDNMAYEMVTGAEEGYASLQIGSVEPSSPLVGPEKVTFFHRLSSVGQGYFGEVWKGELSLTAGQKSVALRKLPDCVALKSLTVHHTVKELFELIDQRNVVKCLGYCQQQCYILYEFISGGTLLTHLQTIGTHSQHTYANLKPRRGQIAESDLLNFAWQTAKGMQFLSSNKIIHGCLCAHNVLLTERKDCKLSDYGLASPLFKKKIKPTRWSSPETMESCVPSLEGDIWSFGIVMWEIASLGAVPYPNMKFDVVQKEVSNGYKMPLPLHCNEEIYTIMTRCWETEGGNRNNFDEILNSLEEILERTHDYMYPSDLDKDKNTPSLER